MNQIREFFAILDYIAVTVWGFTVYDILPLVTSTDFLTTTDGIIKTLLAFVGLIYLSARTTTYIIMSRLNKRYREQEIIEKENANFYRKFNNEFLNKEK